MEKTRFPTLKTAYADRMDKDLPWNEYPRPSMVRDSFFCLNGRWDYGSSEEGDYIGKLFICLYSLLSALQKKVYSARKYVGETYYFALRSR